MQIHFLSESSPSANDASEESSSSASDDFLEEYSEHMADANKKRAQFEHHEKVVEKFTGNLCKPMELIISEMTTML